MKTVKDVSEITGVSIRTFYNGENLIRNPADGAVGDVYVVEFFHMGLYIPGSHALCIHGEDFFFHVLCDGVLILFDELRLIVPVAVTGDSHFHVPVTGVHGLCGVAVPAVIGFLVPVVVL